MTARRDRDEVRELFVGPSAETFPASPLYRTLRSTAADEPAVVEMLTRRRPGQQPSYLLFGAVQYLLLRGVAHPLRDFYASIVGVGGTRDAAVAGPVFADFAHRFSVELEQQITIRLVQTNVVRRAVGLRFALTAIAAECERPVHLVEVGASAGLLLDVDRYRYVLGGRSFGLPDAAVTLASDWLGDEPQPDLDRVPVIASRTGVDLHPVVVTDPDECLWLRALVWPENHADAELLRVALDTGAVDPPTMIAGDATEVCPQLGRDLPAGEPRVVFHAATRMHVAPEHHAAFDRAIDAMGEHGPLFHVWQEPPEAQHSSANPQRPYPHGVIAYHGPDDDRPRPLVQIDGHGRWVAPLGANVG